MPAEPSRFLCGLALTLGLIFSASRPRGGGIGGFAAAGKPPPRSLRVSEIGDKRFALLCVFHTWVNHLSPWHELLRVG